MSNGSQQIHNNFVYYNIDNALLYIWDAREYIGEPTKIKTVEICVSDLPRVVFDRLPGQEILIPAYSGGSKFWTKNFQESYGVELNFTTHEPPLENKNE